MPYERGADNFIKFLLLSEEVTAVTYAQIRLKCKVHKNSSDTSAGVFSAVNHSWPSTQLRQHRPASTHLSASMIWFSGKIGAFHVEIQFDKLLLSRPCKIHRTTAKPNKPSSDRCGGLVVSKAAKEVSKAANKAQGHLAMASRSVLGTKKAAARPPRAIARSSQRML